MPIRPRPGGSPLLSGHCPQLDARVFSSHRAPVFPRKGVGSGGRGGVTSQLEFSVGWVSLLGRGRMVPGFPSGLWKDLPPGLASEWHRAPVHRNVGVGVGVGGRMSWSLMAAGFQDVCLTVTVKLLENAVTMCV
uniref:Uncharacterized protein n=1 Tax=Pipistrellus kuhlii TaxID=59472 RepID=A0A7J7QUR2_PIPKU|nr:hypothetical protein mPipKuh1_008350 [Pipistrellus kuhlii]